MPAIVEANLGDFQSEILFLLIGENPLPNYIAAKLLTKPFAKGQMPILCLIHSKETKPYAEKLEEVLGTTNFRYFPIGIAPSDYFDIEEKISSQLKDVNSQISVGLNYTGGTKAMAVHSYRAIKNLRPNAKFSYLDPRKKFMRFDENTSGADSLWIDISDVNSQVFKMTTIRHNQLLALHGWEKFSRNTNNPITSLRYSDADLDLLNLTNFNGEMFEDFIFSKVLLLKDECHLHDAGTNFEVSIPEENDKSFFELDIFAIRGYQLFVISCTLEGRSDSEGKKLRKAKLFEAVHRAKQFGGAEARIGLVCLADEDRKKLLEKQLKNDHIAVWGEADLRNLKTKLKNWFNA